MSLRITRTGLLDTLQDAGRYGHQHLGVNPGGAMDRFSAQLANALLGASLQRPVIEMHFPAASVLFETATVIAVTGGDFLPVINGRPIPLHHPVAVNKGALLQFGNWQSGAHCYLSVLHDLDVAPWLGSFSTNLKLASGGLLSRPLRKDDVLPFADGHDIEARLQGQAFAVLPWKSAESVSLAAEVAFVIGSEWHDLAKPMQENFVSQAFQITADADRMGYRLAGPQLKGGETEILSSAVSFGTVQLLPDGQLIILMADHQTTGGYPRIAHVITAHLPILAQRRPNDFLRFRLTDLAEAESKIMAQQKYLSDIQIACTFRMQNFLHAAL